MGLNILFEDNQILIVDKPAGVVVNRSKTIKEETLQDWIEKNFKFQISNFKFLRSGIVHRLDRETSGLLIIAKTQEAFENLQRQFADRRVKKEYIALVHGHVPDKSGSIGSVIGRVGKFGKFGVVPQPRLVATIPSRGWDSGREARTDFRVIGDYKLNGGRFDRLIERTKFTKSRINYLKHHAQEYTLLRLFPKTGRTHQIRVHLKSIGHPIVSDLIYAPRKLVKFDLWWCPRLFLHAAAIAFTHPVTGRIIRFESDLPSDLKNAILNLHRLTTNAERLTQF